MGNLSVKVTNPRGQATTTRHLAYDQPSYEPLTLQHPEGVVTEIQRDTLGKPLAITRRSADGSQSLTRRYVYDGYQQLCKTIEPETGATVQDYDGRQRAVVGRHGLTSTTDCNRSEALASGRAVKRSYDAANRLSTLIFPDGRGNQNWSYAPDGLPAEISTQNDPARPMVVNRYQYNRRRLLSGETLQHPDLGSLSLAYGYDANGTLASNIYRGRRQLYAGCTGSGDDGRWLCERGQLLRQRRIGPLCLWQRDRAHVDPECPRAARPQPRCHCSGRSAG